MKSSFHTAVAILCLAGFGCREPCDSDEVRWGDKCAKIPDTGVDEEDASGTTATAAGPDRTNDAGEEGTQDDAEVDYEDSGASDAQCVEGAGTHACVCASDDDAANAAGCQLESVCESNPCRHGKCTEDPEGYTCVCDDGYSAQGISTPCMNVNECANSGLCRPDFPCRDLDPFYTCRGQMADWRMPGSSPGGVPITASYTDNGDGTVLDGVTGLTWQKDAPGDTYAWDNAKRYCADLTIGGFTDWRLPSKIELESVINFARTQPPAIDPIFTNTFSGAYWTSTSPAPSWAYSVNFLAGLTDPGSQNTSVRQHARCVRDGVVRLRDALRYVTTGETVADTRTGLVWERYPPSDLHDWFNHYSRCESLTLEADLDDWRLPTVKELLTIVDTAQGGRSVDLSFFQTPAGPLWTATPVSGTAYYWILYLGPGNTDAADPTTQSLASICVR